MNIKRIIFWWIAIVLFLWWFVITNTFAQSTNPLCSTTLRNELARTDQDTYKILYNITDPLLIKYIDKNYANFNLNKTISWEPLWHDNKKWWCNNLGLFVNGFYNLEVQNWNTFRNKYWSIAWIVNWNELSQSTVTNMQNYIKDHCGFNMWVDGKLGKKTINSINICLPPAWWKLLRNEFKSLAEAKTLFVDAQWKTPIYNGTTFDTNFKPDDIYVDTSKAPWITTEATATAKWLKVINSENDGWYLCSLDSPLWSVIKQINSNFNGDFQSINNSSINNTNNVITNYVSLWKKCCLNRDKLFQDWKSLNWNTDKLQSDFDSNLSQVFIDLQNLYISPNSPSPELLTAFNSSQFISALCKWDSSSTATCRFRPQDGIEPPQEYTNAIANGYEAWDCTTWCQNGYTEVKKWGISVCEKCDLKKCNCGIKLNTNIPFIGRCIMNQQTNNVGQSGNVTTVNTLNAFPILMGALIKLLMSIIMIVCFASLIVWWFMMTVPDQYDTGKWIVKKVIRTIVALWSLWTILYLINPNFFS